VYDQHFKIDLLSVKKEKKLFIGKSNQMDVGT